jgi:hypothetical protein
MEHAHIKTPRRCHQTLESQREKVASLSEKGKNSRASVKGSCTAKERSDVAGEKRS